jgi:DNA repair protein RecO (recombination protein O)
MFVLHQRPLGETGWLLNAWEQNSGHQRLVFRRQKGQPLALATQYLADWSSVGEWSELQFCHSDQGYEIADASVMAFFYINELLVRLLPFDEDQNELFEFYRTLLQVMSSQLGQNAVGPEHDSEAISLYLEPWLRSFEYRLLCELGYGFSWGKTQEGQPVVNGRRYDFSVETGFTASPAGRWPGDWLLQMESGAPNDWGCWKMAKALLRESLEYRLAGEVRSRIWVRPPMYVLKNQRFEIRGAGS